MVGNKSRKVLRKRVECVGEVWSGGCCGTVAAKTSAACAVMASDRCGCGCDCDCDGDFKFVSLAVVVLRVGAGVIEQPYGSCWRMV